ncbi:MAG: trehalose-phosphatase [Alphaproteobacteria bacterium]
MNQIVERMPPDNNYSRQMLPEPQADWALFLDVDGTLVDIAETPDGVKVPAALGKILADVDAALGGALALVSGRSIAGIEKLLGPQRCAIAGLHGLEIRQANETAIRRAPVDADCLQEASEVLRAFVGDHDGVTLEDKGLTLAVHYRTAAAAKDAVVETVTALAADSGGKLHAIHGKMVVVLKPPAVNKGTAIETLMASPSFAGRRAVFAGDDVTDEDGFAAVNRMDGYSIRVGVGSIDGSQARWSCGGVAEFARWLANIPEILAKA